MADGDNAGTSVGKRILLDRETLQFSYFCDSHVVTCISEQHKLLGSQLAEKEKEAEITYDKPLSELFSGEAQIDPAFVQLLFDSNAPANLDGLINDLSTLAGSGGKNQTRFFDLLFVTGKGAKLLEELKVTEGASYDLYDANANGRLSTMTMYASLLSDFDVEKSKSNRFTANLAMLLSMLATAQEPLVSSALVSMSKCLNLPWDALLLARYYFGSEHEITRKVHDEWTKAVLMKEANNRFSMIKMARSLNSSNLKDVAHTLMSQVGSKTTGYELIDAYRCLALTLAKNSELSELERRLEVAEALTMMRSIFVTMLGWGKTLMAKSTLADLAKRASGDIPPDIYQIGLTCLVELVEVLQRNDNDQSSVVPDGIFTTMATKWRTAMTGGHGEMSKLKAGTLGSQKVLYGWIQQLAAQLRVPLLDEPNLNRKMECVFIATEFLHEMLRWAATDQEGEKLHLLWPPIIKMKAKDECIVIRDESQRGRTSSVASARSTSTTKEEGKKQTKKGDGKEERLTVPVQDARNQSGGGQKPPLQDVRKQSAPRSEGNQQNNESWRNGMQPRSEQQYPNRGMMNHKGGGDAGHEQANQQNSGASAGSTSWQRAQNPQDPRKNQQNTGGVGDFNGSQEARGGAAVLMNLLSNPAQIDALLAQTHAPPHGTQFSGHSNRMDQPRSPRPHEAPFNGFVPTSASSSGIDLTTKTEEYTSSPSIAFLPVIDQESLAAMTPAQILKDSIGPLSDMYNNQQSQPTPSPITRTLKSPIPDPTPEQIQSRLDESMKRNASAAQLAASGQPPVSPLIPQQPTMGTAAVNKARERRSLENVQQVQQPADSQYEKLMEMEKKEDGDETPIAPEPGEMNKLFTGNSKGQSMLPPNLLTEEDGASAVFNPTTTTIMTPPIPTLVAAAVESGTSMSSLDLTQLTPPDIVLPSTNRGYESSSADDSMLTPITEASQETFGSRAGISESDAPGLVDESMDTVFEESIEHDANTLRVDMQSDESAIGSQTTPKWSDLCSVSSQNQYDCRDDLVRQEYSLGLSPLVTSSLHNVSCTTESSELNTVVPSTSQSMGMRKEAEDANQMPQPLHTPVPVVFQQQQCSYVQVETPMVEEKQSGHETSQMQMAMAPVVPAAPTSELQQQMTQPVAPTDSLSFAPPTLPPIEMQPIQQLNQPMETSVQMQSNMQQPQSVMMSYPPVSAPISGSSFPPPVVAPSDPLMSVSVMPHFGETATSQSSHSATSVHQMDHSMNEQIAPTLSEQQRRPEFVQQITTMVVTQTQTPMEQTVQSDSTSFSNGQQLNWDGAESEVQERVTSCGVSYKFSPVHNEAADSTVVSMGEEQQQIHEPVQQSNTLDSFLSMMDTGGGEVLQDPVNVHQTFSHSVTNTHSNESLTVNNDGIGASEIGGSVPFPVNPYVPSVPSSALTTPEPCLIEHQNHGHSNNIGWGGESMMETCTSAQTSATSLYSTPAFDNNSEHQEQQFLQSNQALNGGDIASQMSVSSHSTSLVLADHSEQQHSSFQQSLQALNGGDIAPQEPITYVPPTWIDPFAQQQPLVQQTPVEQGPCFGAGGLSAAQNTQQHQNSGYGGQQPQFVNSNYGLGQDQGHQNQNRGQNSNRPYNQHRGGRGGGGDSSGFSGGGFCGASGDNGGVGNRSKGACFNCGVDGHRSNECTQPKKERGERGGRRGGGHHGSSGFGGGSGGGQGGFNGFGGGNSQQQHGSGFDGGDNGQQKSNPSRQGVYGGQDARASSGGVNRGRGGGPSGRGYHN